MDCTFCLSNNSLRGEILYEDDLWYCVSSIDPVLSVAGLIVPKRHITSPFEIDSDEWTTLKKAIDEAKALIDKEEPDGYNIGWNVGATAGQNVEHAHLHIIARFKDEPLAGKGIRYALKDPKNKRKHQ